MDLIYLVLSLALYREVSEKRSTFIVSLPALNIFFNFMLIRIHISYFHAN